MYVTTDLMHSKISNSHLNNEIQGENGALVIKHVALCEKVELHQDKVSDLTLNQSENSMVYEAHFFAQQIKNQQMDEQAVNRAKTTAMVITEIRRLTKVKFPTDGQ